MQKALKTLAAVAVAGMLTSAAQGALIVNFIDSPSSALLPEIEMSEGGVLDEGVGATSSGDGAMPPNLQMPPGLLISTPFRILGVAGSEVNVVDQSTRFFDASLDLEGISAVGPAAITPVPGSPFSLVQQVLGAGTFTLRATDGTLLLTGSLSSGEITGLNATNAAAVLSLNVTYSGGLIHTANLAAGGQAEGSLSFSLLDVNPLVNIAPDGQIGAFTANATGQFSAIPEPGTMGLALVGLTILGARRRRA